MKQVSVKLSRPWMTEAGLRRPMEGPIRVSATEAKKIEAEKAGKIIDEPKPEPKFKPKKEVAESGPGVAAGSSNSQTGNAGAGRQSS